MQTGGHTNDLPGQAQHLKKLGTGPGDVNGVSVLGSLGQKAREISNRENDGSIPQANPTGMVAGQNGSIVVRGKIGDGPHGSHGTGRGDYDYYKFSAAAGQLISLVVEANSLDKSFNPVAAIYDASGNVVTYNDNHVFDIYDLYTPAFDPAIRFLAPASGTYYAVVFSSVDFQSSPFQSGSGAGVFSEGDYRLSITTESPQLLGTSEENGAIQFATPTGIQAGVDGFVYASGYIGDGLFGSQGTGTGDYDFFRFDAAAGQRIYLSADTDPALHTYYYFDPVTGIIHVFGMDTKIIVYDDFGQIVDAGGYAADSDDYENLDARLDFRAPYTGAYFVAVSGVRAAVTYEEYVFYNYLANPFDPSSGGSAGTEGSYQLLIKTETIPDRDAYSVDLAPGDVISVALTGGAGLVELYDPDGRLLNFEHYVTSSYQAPSSPALKDIGDRGFLRVVSEPGRYTIVVAHDDPLVDYSFAWFQTISSPYELKVRVDRPGMEQRPVYAHQKLFIDFDGAPSSALFAVPNVGFVPTVSALSPFRTYLPDWGFSLADENALIDSIMARVTERMAVDVGGVSGRGLNGEFLITGRAGDFQIEILNSRDHADNFETDRHVSRVIVASSLEEMGSPFDFFGIAAYIDVGNFETNDTSLAVAKEMGDYLISLGMPLDPSTTPLDFFAEGFAMLILHEAGHNFGNWHTNPFNTTTDIMDNALLDFGQGPDGVFGSADDVRLRFGTDPDFGDNLRPGMNDTLNTIAFGLSTGMQAGAFFDSSTGTLYVSGQIDDGRKDKLKVKNAGSNIKVYVNDELVLTRPAAGVNRVVLNGSSDKDELDASNFDGVVTLFGRGGKDKLQGGSNNDMLFGGDGDDELVGNGGHDILVGGDGDDDLSGGGGRDILIGGRGEDKLNAGGGGDLLIGARTAFDANIAALSAIRAEWTSNRSYESRTANLRGNGAGPRANENFFLRVSGPNQTVFNDGDQDKLTGGDGRDWYFAKLTGSNKDKLFGRENNELVEEL